MSSIESLGAPSTLKLPLWDKASAEFCFAKSRELLTKPSAWTSYMNVEFDNHILDNNATKQNLMKSAEFLENGNRKSIAACESILDLETKNSKQNGKLSYGMENSNMDFPREAKRVSTSYVDRYFDQPKYLDDDDSRESPVEKLAENFEKINNLEHGGMFFTNFPEFNVPIQGKNQNSDEIKSEPTKFDIDVDKNLDGGNFESSRNRSMKFDLPREKVGNFDYGTRPKVLESTKLNAELKKFDLQKIRAGKVSFVPRNQEMKIDKSALKPSLSDGSRNLEAVRINIQSFRKIEQNQNGHDNYSFVMSNNPLFVPEPENQKKDSPIYSSSESLRVNFQRLRRKSDAEANSQVELSSKIFAEKYQREISGMESVKNYLDSKKGQVLNLGMGKLTQNMIQLGKNIEQNSRNIDVSLSKPMMRNLEMPTQTQTPLRNLGGPMQKPKHLDLNVPLQGKHGMKLNSNQNPISPALHQHILEPPKLYQNDRKNNDIFGDKNQGNFNVFRPRTSSLSEHRKSPLRHARRSFHPKNDSSDDSDSISHSETDIRSRLRYKRRHKRMSHNFRLNFKNRSQFLHPDAARGFSSIELCGKSPPPSTSFLNSLSPPFSSRNNLLSWPESAPSSSLTFTSNSDLDSDTSSEYPEFTTDIMTFPPSPAP